MKDIFKKRYWFYACLIFSILFLTAYFSTDTFQWFIITLMLLALLLWLYYIEQQRLKRINQLQKRLNTLSKHDIKHLASIMDLPVETLRNLSNTHLRHTQIQQLQQLLSMEEQHNVH